MRLRRRCYLNLSQLAAVRECGYCEYVGLTYVTVDIAPLSGGGKKFSDTFLVDTGAIHCLAPKDRLSEIGIAIEGREVYELADGTTREFDYGFARVSFMGSETVSKVIFADAGSEPLLGVVALESTGIGVDPVTRSLRRMTAIPLK